MSDAPAGTPEIPPPRKRAAAAKAEPTDPNARLAQAIGVAPDVLAAKFKELGLRVVDANDTTNGEQEARHVEWMRKLQDGTLSERKIIGG